MSGFQFTPTGIVPLPAPTSIAHEAADDMAAPFVEAVAKASKAAAQLAPTTPFAPASKPLNIVKLAQARLRDLDREIKRLRGLEAERDELRRLLAAAKNKSLAVVRELNTAKRG